MIDLFGYLYPETYIIYTSIFWGGLGGFCAVLLVYNLIKMFKLDEDITAMFNDLLSWFMTPPTEAEK